MQMLKSLIDKVTYVHVEPMYTLRYITLDRLDLCLVGSGQGTGSTDILQGRPEGWRHGQGFHF